MRAGAPSTGHKKRVDERPGLSRVRDFRMVAVMDFEWDEAKAQRNIQKHAISFDEAITVFADPNVVMLDTSRADQEEPRSKAIGLIDGRVFIVVFTRRGGIVRMISARRANGQEERCYGADPKEV